MKLRQYALPALLASATLLPVAATAATTTGTLPVQITIDGTCLVVAGDMNFGTHTSLTSNVDASGSLTVNCTDTLPYTITLNAGGGTGATVALRRMSLGTDTISYELYSDANRTMLWGDGTLGTNTVSNTGTGLDQPIPVYGRVIVQTTPPNGTYQDAVTATITW